MKNQYVGDIGDYGKYGLLRFLANHGIRIGINWYLTENDRSNDGIFISYLNQPSNRCCDPELFDTLKEIAHRSDKNVQMIENAGIISNADYYSAVLKNSGSDSKAKKINGRLWYNNSNLKEYQNIIWLLDPRFDFTIPWFIDSTGISFEHILFAGSYHGAGRRLAKTLILGDVSTGQIVFLEPEELNRLIVSHLVPGERTFMVPFTGAYLPKIFWLDCSLTTGKIAIQANNKWWQYLFFSRTQIPTPATVRLECIDSQNIQVEQCLRRWDRVLVKHSELSGGYKMKIIDNIGEWNNYYNEQSEQKAQELLLSQYIPHDQSFAGTGIVTKDGDIHWCGATEQVLYQELYYEGLVFPPYTTPEQLAEIKRLTILAGKELARHGYSGYYSIDFISGKQGIHAVEVNARFCFSTLLFACCSGKEFWNAVDGYPEIMLHAPRRLVLGKIKGKMGRCYSGLQSNSDILSWFSGGEGSFRTYFCGTEEPETFIYGSYIGIFGKFFSESHTREQVIDAFWSECLSAFDQTCGNCNE